MKWSRRGTTTGLAIAVASACVKGTSQVAAAPRGACTALEQTDILLGGGMPVFVTVDCCALCEAVDAV
eukprot:6586701-Prymnesium_polylepis.3